MNKTIEPAALFERVRHFVREWTNTARGPGVRPAPDEAAFNQLALELFALQYEHSQVLRRLSDARGLTPARVRHWRQIPALPARAFKDFEITILPPGERTLAFHSSGTTGQQPSRHFHSPETLRLYETSLLAWFQEQMLDAGRASDNGPAPAQGLRLLSLVPPAAAATHSSLAHMVETVRRAFPWRAADCCGSVDAGGAWTLDTERAFATLEACQREGQPVALLGTAFGFVHLLDALAQDRRFSLAPGSRVMETGGYKGRSRSLPKAELHAWISNRLGLPPGRVVTEYGMCELSSQAYDALAQPGAAGQNAPRWLRFPPWARIQAISPETGAEAAEGEPGLLRIFDLANAGSSVGLQTEDLVRRHGDGFELLGRALRAEPRGCSLMAA